VATLTAFKFDSPDGARKAFDALIALQRQQPMPLIDVAVVSWPKGKSRPSTHQADVQVGSNSLDGAFWGMLFGLIFFEPVLSRRAYWKGSALAVALTEVGVDDNFTYQIRSRVTEGTSALFAIADDALADRVVEASGGLRPELMATNLARDHETKLRYVFAQDGLPARETPS
jgi:uncharacterized membrane protein